MIGGMFTKPATIPAPFWLYYFNVDDIDATAQRVKAGGGEILDGPLEVPGGSWVIRCADPQGAVFALEGTAETQPVGYFERAASAIRAGRTWSSEHGPEKWIPSFPKRPCSTEGIRDGSDLTELDQTLAGSSCRVPRPSANWPTGPSTWNSIPVIFANRSILVLPIAQPPSPMSVVIR